MYKCAHEFVSSTFFITNKPRKKKIRIEAIPTFWLPYNDVVSARIAGPKKAVALPERAYNPNISVNKGRGVILVNKARLAD